MPKTKQKAMKKHNPAGSRGKTPQAPPPPRLSQPGVRASDPQFGEGKHSPDPTEFLLAVTDAQFYKQVDKETANQLIQGIPPLHDPKNLLLSLADVYGSKGSAKDAEITSARHNLFHAADVPSFFFHLGDVVYNFGEDEYCYDQLFDPFAITTLLL
jgi:hypothetical protein